MVLCATALARAAAEVVRVVNCKFKYTDKRIVNTKSCAADLAGNGQPLSCEWKSQVYAKYGIAHFHHHNICLSISIYLAFSVYRYISIVISLLLLTNSLVRQLLCSWVNRIFLFFSGIVGSVGSTAIFVYLSFHLARSLGGDVHLSCLLVIIHDCLIELLCTINIFALKVKFHICWDI